MILLEPAEWGRISGWGEDLATALREFSVALDLTIDTLMDEDDATDSVLHAALRVGLGLSQNTEETP